MYNMDRVDGVHLCSQDRDEAAGDFPRRVSSAMENSIQLLDLEEAPTTQRGISADEVFENSFALTDRLSVSGTVRTSSMAGSTV